MLKPHSLTQRQMITYDGNVVAFCGRRFGKTDGYVQRLFYWMQRDPGLYWWVGLSWRSASLKRAWRGVSTIARQVLTAMGLDARQHINRSRNELIIPGLGELWFRTGDNPSSLAGEGIKGAVVDEFSLLPEIVWTEYLEATLLDYGGWVAFGGVPKGNNWAAQLWRQAAGREGWLQVHATTYDNPFIDRAAIDEIREHTPARFFDQEYLAEIVDDAGSVFRNVRVCVAEGPETPAGDRHYVMGVDWAQSYDFTVLTVIERETGRVCALDRFNQIGWDVQRGRLRALAQQWNVSEILAEENSIGGPNIEQLQSEGLPVKAFTTTSQSKQDVIVALQLAFERGEIGIPNDDVLITELQAFEATRLPSGRWRYAAPEGMHDDCVISLALAWEAANRSTNVQIVRSAANLYGSRQRGQKRPVRTLYGSRR